MTHEMTYPATIKNVVPAERISRALGIVHEETASLHSDYATCSYSEFLQTHIYPDSCDLERLQARCLYRGIADMLISDTLLAEIGRHLKKPQFLCKTRLRYAFPGMTSNGKERLDNVLNSPLHYDEYQADTRSVWIPLHDIDEETGALCFTDNAKLMELTGNGLTPDYAHNHDLSEEYVSLLRSEVTEVRCTAGDAVMFDRTKLHGGTYPKTKTRISVDLRWVESPDGYALSDTRKIIRKFAVNELMRLKDTAFIRRHPWLAALYLVGKVRASLKLRTRILAVFNP